MTVPARPRTAAATDAWRERGAHTAALELVKRVPWLTDADLVSLTERLLVECAERGVPIPWPFNAKEPAHPEG